MAKLTILIIEDETALLYALNAELTTAGFNVLTSADGKEGWEQMQKAKPDFVLLDIWLPSMTGLEILAQREGNPAAKKIPVLVLSNSGNDQTIRDAKRYGIVDYLVKTDHSLEEIVKLIKSKIS